jgi:hypothetical protein
MASPPTIDVAHRAERIYAERLQRLLEPAHLHEFVAIEPDSGDYYLGATLSEAVQAARLSHPDRLAFAMRVGHPTAIHLGVLAT